MPNGVDQNWVRLLAAVDGFYLEHRSWPNRVLLHGPAIKTLQTHVFSEASFAKITLRIELVPSDSGVIAEDDNGNQYNYGKQGFPENRPSPSAEEWFGVQPDGPEFKFGR